MNEERRNKKSDQEGETEVKKKKRDKDINTTKRQILPFCVHLAAIVDSND